MSFDRETVLIDEDGKKYKILASREIWLDIYDIEEGKIRTLSAEELRDEFTVIIPKPEFTETSQIETGAE